MTQKLRKNSFAEVLFVELSIEDVKRSAQNSHPSKFIYRLIVRDIVIFHVVFLLWVEVLRSQNLLGLKDRVSSVPTRKSLHMLPVCS